MEIAAEGVRFFTVTSTNEQDVLEWLNPAGAAYSSTEIVFRTDRFPTAPGDGTTIYNTGTAGMKDRLVHGPLSGFNGVTHYYAAFVHRSVAPILSAGPILHRAAVQQRRRGEVGLQHRRLLHHAPHRQRRQCHRTGQRPGALCHGAAGRLAGSGPPDGSRPSWVAWCSRAHRSSPSQPTGRTPSSTSGPRTATSIPWTEPSEAFPRRSPGHPDPSVAWVQAAPAAIYTNWGGGYSYLLVGTRDGGADNVMVALNPDTPGNIIGTFDNGGAGSGIGIINSMASVDYATDRVYFTSHRSATGSSGTLWCLQMGPPGPVLGLVWKRDLQDIDSSPVLQNGRIYVGSMDGGGTVYSINAATGAIGDDRTFVHGDGQVKGFVWPDRDSQDLYFATTNSVWGISDTGAAVMPPKFPAVTLGGGITPSTILFVPGSTYVYAGGSDGQLWEIDVLPATPTLKSVPLGDGLALVGAPSLDWFYDLIHVGTEAGIFYAIQVPLP